MVTDAISRSESVVVHTSCGTSDPRIDKTNRVFVTKGLDSADISMHTSALYGRILGSIAKNVVAKTKIKRVVLSGGDTSSYAARAMNIEAVEMMATLSRGAPLCKAYAPGSPVDGLEVTFKGGQVGSEDFFLTAKRGLRFDV
jgi:3-oxoisoapionate kinase